MKRLLYTLFFAFCTICTYAQAPQVICYQGGATNAEGDALANQNISIRAAIVRGAANGIVEWSETHTTTTDDFGLFTIDAGTGMRVGGEQQNFSDINWGSGEYFLRIEMDPFGGNNYDLMGTTQILSVPYALFAEGATNAENADRANTAGVADSSAYANVAGSSMTAETAGYADEAGNATTADTATVAQTALVAAELSGENDISNTNELQSIEQNGDSLSLSGGNTIFLDVNDQDADTTNELQTLTYRAGVLSISGGNTINFAEDAFSAPGASSDFPLGIIGDHMVLKSGDYKIPFGKTFFMTAGPSKIVLNGHGNADGVHEHPTTPNMPVFKENTSITDCFCTGILMDNIPYIKAITIDFFDSPSYSVPEGTILFIKSGLANDLPGWLVVDNDQMEFFRPNFTRGTRIISFPEFTVLKKPAAFEEMVLTGYLISKDLSEIDF